MTSKATEGQTPDMYGQVHPVETEELIREKREEFEEELLKLPEEALASLKQAQEKCPEQLTDDFKLMFLRCEVFNADKAAQRYARYWDKRIEICGPDRAFLPMTMDGVLHGDEHTVKTGCLQVLEGCKEPMGRGVIMFTPLLLEDGQYHGERRIIRVLWYVVHACLEHVSAQKHGMLCMLCPGPIKLRQTGNGLVQLLIESCQGCLPMRISGCHVCPAPPITKIVWPIIKLFFVKRIRKRILFHYGSPKQIMETLETYGMERESLPLELGGNHEHNHSAWILKRRREGK